MDVSLKGSLWALLFLTFAMIAPMTGAQKAASCASCVSMSQSGASPLLSAALGQIFGTLPAATKDCGGLATASPQAPCSTFCVSQRFSLRLVSSSTAQISGVVRGCASTVLKGLAGSMPQAPSGPQAGCAAQSRGTLMGGLVVASLWTAPCSKVGCNNGPLPHPSAACDNPCAHNQCPSGACAAAFDGVSFTCGGAVPSKAPPTAAPATDGWNYAARILQDAMDTTVDPCQDFWQYSCGGWIKKHPVPPTQSTTSVGDPIFDNMIKAIGGALLQPNNATNSWPKAIQTAQSVYNICLSVPTMKLDGSHFANVIAQAGGWPALNQQYQETPKSLWTHLGWLASSFGTSTLVSPYVDTDWLNPVGNLLYLSQASLTYPAIYYVSPSQSTKTRVALLNIITAAVQDVAGALGISVPNPQVFGDAIDLINMEYVLAQALIPSDKERENLPLYNKFTLASASARWPNVQWQPFLATFLNTPNDPGTFIVTEPTFMDALNGYLATAKPRTLQNYLVWRLVWSKSEFLHYLPGFARFKEALRQAKRDLQDIDELRATPDVDCTLQVGSAMPYAAGRLYIDFHFNRIPGDTRNAVHRMTTSIMAAFRQMLANLNWMDAVTKATAVGKVNNLLQNYAYPDWIMNNTALNLWYSDLNVLPSDSFWDLSMKISGFQHRQSLRMLAGPVNRRSFSGGPAINNAWYQPQYNSITFPAGILNPPFFRPDFPPSVNYGGMGCVEGHELTHGFDDQGVQWTGNGTLNPWIDKSSLSGFKKMAQCVIDEYSEFCYRFNMTHLCVNGANTQGENIADNGGMKAAYLALKARELLRGVEQPLPGAMGRFNSDQLFFLSYGLSWCEADKPSRVQRQLLLDVHSPARVRVVATIRNFPPFQRAFNCPANAPMSPTKHCNVW